MYKRQLLSILTSFLSKGGEIKIDKAPKYTCLLLFSLKAPTRILRSHLLGEQLSLTGRARLGG